MMNTETGDTCISDYVTIIINTETCIAFASDNVTMTNTEQATRVFLIMLLYDECRNRRHMCFWCYYMMNAETGDKCFSDNDTIWWMQEQATYLFLIIINTVGKWFELIVLNNFFISSSLLKCRQLQNNKKYRWRSERVPSSVLSSCKDSLHPS